MFFKVQTKALDIPYIYRKDRHTGKIAAGGIWASKSGKNSLAVAEHPGVTLTDVP